MSNVCAKCGATLIASGHCPSCMARMALMLDTTDEPGGRMLGGYELFEEIGRGGMGVVYRARQVALKREVAVKMLIAGEFASPEYRRRFRQEAEMAARLRHPAIVGIHEIGEEDGQLFFAMELVEGRSLSDLSRNAPLPAGDAASYVKLTAEAVHYAHGEGVLHRDLKPANILVDGFAKPRVADFGLARMIVDGEGGERTNTGQMLGSPGFAAPEQSLGGTVDARTDVYGLGAVLYHLLTSRPPFQGPTLDSVIVQLREAEPIAPRKLNPTVPRDLETICLHALHKDPAKRYPSAAALAEDLTHFLAGEPILAHPPSLLGRTARWCKRRPVVAGLTALVFALVVVLVIGSLTFAQKQARLEHRSSLMARARIDRSEGVAGSRSAALAAVREAWSILPSAELRSEAIACLSVPEITLESTGAPSTPPASGGSADGKSGVRFENGAVVVLDKSTGREAARIALAAGPVFAQLDDRARRLALCEQGAKVVRIFALPSGKILHTLTFPSPPKCADWAGELLAVAGCDDRLIHIWDTTDGTRLHRFNGHDAPVESVKFRKNGQELVSLAQDSVLRIWHAGRGTETLRMEGVRQHSGPAWWSDDGARFHSVRTDGTGMDLFHIRWPESVKILSPGRDEPRSENNRSMSPGATGALITAVDEQVCRVWSPALGRVVATFPKEGDEWMSALLVKNDTEVWLAGWQRALRRIPVTQNGAWPDFGETEHSGFDSGPLLVGSSADGNALALTNTAAKGLVMVAFTDTKKRIALPVDGPYCAAIQAGNKLAVTGSYINRGADVWSLADGKLERTLAHPGIVLGALFDNSAKTLWLWGDNAVQRINTETWQPEAPPILRHFAAFTVGPDGSIAASAQRNEIILHRASDLTEIVRLHAPSTLGTIGSATLAFSQDGRSLVVHTATGAIAVWDITHLREELREIGMDWEPR